jgi:hypothetical protein
VIGVSIRRGRGRAILPHRGIAEGADPAVRTRRGAPRSAALQTRAGNLCPASFRWYADSPHRFPLHAAGCGSVIVAAELQLMRDAFRLIRFRGAIVREEHRR